MKLKDQIVWITGSARRVGRSIALACADEGADIIVHCNKSRDEAEMVVDLIKQKKGRNAWIVQGDHSKREDVQRMVSEIREETGRLTALVNSAAIFPQVRFQDVTDEDFYKVINVNLYGPFLCAQAATPLLREAGPGRLINITDWAVERPYRNYAPYMAAKGGLATLTKALARELAPEILVNAVAPGPVLEPPDLEDDLKEKIVAKIPLQKWGTPEVISQAVVFLLENDYITGQTITVDGGRSIGG